MKRTLTTLLALAVAAPAFAYGVEPTNPNHGVTPSHAEMRAEAVSNPDVTVIERDAQQTDAGGAPLSGTTLKFQTIFDSAEDADAPVTGRELH